MRRFHEMRTPGFRRGIVFGLLQLFRIPSGNLLHFELLRGDSPRVAVFPSPIVEQLNTVKYPNTSILFALE